MPSPARARRSRSWSAWSPGLDRAGLDAVLAQVNAALARVELVATRVDSLELRPRTARSTSGVACQRRLTAHASANVDSTAASTS